VKNQYSASSAFPRQDHEPRLLSLDNFKPHINKGRTPSNKPESTTSKAKREKEEKLQAKLRA
jgi:hypothetical protein